MKNFFLLLVLVIICSHLNAQPAGRQHTNFDDDWRFHFGNSGNPAKDFNYTIANIFSKTGKADSTAIERKFNDTAWRKVNLPHDWVVELPFITSPNFDVMVHGYKPVGGLYPETSVGWYRKHFKVARADSGQRFQIQFDGIFRDAKIWLNGIYVGSNLSGYVGAAFDVTDFIEYDKENVLVVRADASQYEGWFYEGAGIYRHVWLNKFNNAHIVNDGVFVHAVVAKNNAVVTIETTIENKNLSVANAGFSAYITTREGVVVAKTKEQPVFLAVNEIKTIKQTLTVINPRLWSVDEPYLYRVIPVIKNGSKVIDSMKMRFGIRTITVDAARGLLVNGKSVKVKGTNNHQDHAGVGSALPDYLQYYRINALKEMGANAYRTSHHVPTPELLDACDSLGMLVLDEQRLLNSSPEYINQFERLLKRDRSRACVFLWSIGNEEGYIQTNTTGKRIAQTYLAKQQELDPTRTSTYAADVANVFRGVNEVIPVRGFNYRQFGVADYHRDHPNQPVIGTEMGSTTTTRGIYVKDSIKGFVPDEDIYAPWWASRAEEWWPLAATNPWWMGGFVWTGFDYRGEPTPYEWLNISSQFGMMDACGFPKNIYYYYQSWWSDKDVLHISPHWNWKGKEGKPIDVWVNTNADNVELFLNGKSLGNKPMKRNSHLQWSVPYEAGTLEAVAFKNGKRITSKVETTGAPYEVVVTPYKTTMLADGKDASVINISIVDRQGREVPDANNLIKFSVRGDAKIIGVGNGDPGSHEADKCMDGNWQRSVFNGKCQVILQAGTNTSNIKFTATADGLQSGSTDIFTISPGEVHKVTAKPFISVKHVDKMLGADISFLPELESRGLKFSDKGIEKDGIQILKDHGFNYVRLRIFNNPAADSGYSPKKGFCDLEHTKQMAKRIKAAGMKFLLDFHYSDYWADPGKQYKPSAWKDLSFEELKHALHDYTKSVMQALKAQGTLPDMVQVGNEINHGMMWPDGRISNLDNLAQLINEGINAVKEVSPSSAIMLHVALGGQNAESVFFINSMLERGLQWDVLGLSYYPRWHGTLTDLQNNLTDIAKRYKFDVIVVEYSQLKREVNEIAFNLPDGKGKGTAIWEPLSWGEKFVDNTGKTNDLILIYDDISKKYLYKN